MGTEILDRVRQGRQVRQGDGNFDKKQIGRHGDGGFDKKQT